MRRKLAFKARKWSFRGLFFMFIFAKKFLLWVYHLLKNIKKEAISGQGECPCCNSLNIIYEETPPMFIDTKFKCLKCQTKGYERYNLDYYKSYKIKEK